MQNTIIYFTGTGNSLAVARLMAQRLPQSKVISVNEMLRHSNPIIATETCGFVFPVYFQNVPEIMRRLARRIQVPENAYMYAVSTNNGDVAYSHFTLDSILRKKGRRLQAGFAVLMPSNVITPYDALNSEEETTRRIEAASSRIYQISAKILEKKNMPFEGSRSLRKHLKAWRNIFRYKVVCKVPKSFWVTEACNLCGLCARICPENNIRIESEAVVWGKQCQMCFACLHWCPQHAIQNGPDTINRKRYHHPDVKINDLILRD